ncbi:hypothetical protein HZA38_05310 [Candidatus Peregrinibacteria bacterium]|nr:hypothetical protein [Candidatus Peregrinibacteria bacterium]
MPEELDILMQAVKNSPLLTEEQRSLLVSEIEKGEPYSPEFVNAIGEFIGLVAIYENLNEAALIDECEEIDRKIDEASGLNLSPEEVQKRVKEIISLVNNFIAEVKKIEKEAEVEVENIIHTKAEGSAIDSIRESLKQPKKDENS